MPIAGIDPNALKKILGSYLTPSDFIKTPERLFGRERHLVAIERALSSPGRQVFIFGDRGVGKTSLALTAANIHTASKNRPIHVNCGTASGFAEVVQAIGTAVLPPKSRFERSGSRPSMGASVLGFGLNFNSGAEVARSIPLPTNLNEALEIVRYIEHVSAGQPLVIVIDEMERVTNSSEKDKFAEFVKNFSTKAENIRLIFCGIASDLTDLIGSHPSASRILEPIELRTISHDSLWKIIQAPADEVGIKIDRNKLIRISQISDGFPHYVHLIGECLFWVMNDDEYIVGEVTHDHYRAAIRNALERTEAYLRTKYYMATKKTKNTEDYEESLWALADKTSDMRQLPNIYDTSYLKIMAIRHNRSRLSKEKFNQRLLSLRKESHGNIVVGHGSGWFSYRENIMRGYVRLDAENKGIPIGAD